ncbi:hypothetical protein [Oceanibaculum sp.]|uniref:hypothetical protein n=1 Tax=Oceanibaculum sp. TaxID=1903597 RepID=UPI00258F43F7|nr:hypothetical protein [Oceanibaculum sp.]MCH2393212.1 hypothetical protein [Oceanibaculum sp.]
MTEHAITPAPQADKAVLQAVLDTEDRLSEVEEVLSALQVFIGAAGQRIDHETIGNGLAVVHSQLEAINARQKRDFMRLHAIAKGRPEAAGPDGAIIAAWEAFKGLARDLGKAEGLTDAEYEMRFYSRMDALAASIERMQASTPRGMAIKGRLALYRSMGDAAEQPRALGDLPAPTDLNALPDAETRGLWRMIVDAEAMAEGGAA